jgi:hypothetical protein
MFSFGFKGDNHFAKFHALMQIKSWGATLLGGRMIPI